MATLLKYERVMFKALKKAINDRDFAKVEKIFLNLGTYYEIEGSTDA